jgi:two-component system NtrC family response regulator
LLTAYGNIADGVQAIKNGAFDYLVKGDDNDKIIPLLGRAVEKTELQKKVWQLEARLNKKYGFDSVNGSSHAIQAAITLAKKVAPTNAPVLLTGETGTGKEVFAQAIHYASARSNNPFVAFNCSALSKDLMESELFGHKAGAFTGATRDKKGLIEEAKGGTLFLDEIGEMPQELQPKLLRFLENGTYYRVGDAMQRIAEVRLIAATNRDLQKEIEAGHFRSDLYYRIAVFNIPLPSLRERHNDILLLAHHYLNIYSLKTNKQITGITKDAEKTLQKYPWPGNVRELKNVIERAVILEDSTAITINSLPYELQQTSPVNGPSALHLTTAEQLHIQKVLKHTNGNKAEAARLLDIGLATLYRKIEEYGLK